MKAQILRKTGFRCPVDCAQSLAVFASYLFAEVLLPHNAESTVAMRKLLPATGPNDRILSNRKKPSFVLGDKSIPLNTFIV